MSDFKRRGLAKRTIKYTNKDGEEKNQYITVGEYFATDHSNRQAVKLYATATSDEVWLNIYIDEEFNVIQTADEFPDKKNQETHNFNKQVSKDVVLEDIDDKPVDLSEIPF